MVIMIIKKLEGNSITTLKKSLRVTREVTVELMETAEIERFHFISTNALAVMASTVLTASLTFLPSTGLFGIQTKTHN